MVIGRRALGIGDFNSENLSMSIRAHARDNEHFLNYPFHDEAKEVGIVGQRVFA